MKLAYLGQMADVSGENGIAKKIAMQTAAWRAAGHATRYFALARSAGRWAGLGALETDLIDPTAAWSRIRRAWLLAERVRAWSPAAIYFRYAYHSPGLPGLFRAIPTIAEINSDDLREYPLTLDPFRVFYHRCTRALILRRVSAFVSVTRELAARFSPWDRPTLVIGNGIALHEFRPLPPAGSAAPRLVFLGTAGSPWHGLERVAELARLLPDWSFDIVGLDAREWQLQAGSAPGPNLCLHGRLARAEYEPVLAGATAALGSLALYKNGMEEACPLKVRECLALGLPVLAAYEDTDIPANADYFLRLPNRAAALNPERERILRWLQSWRNRRVPRFAIAHLDTKVKERQRLDFIQGLLSPARTE